MKNTIFYKYVNIEKPDKLRIKLKGMWRKNKVKGKILIAKEGINGAVTGNDKDIKKVIKEIKNINLLSDMQIKVDATNQHDFDKLYIKLRKQIITTGSWDANPKDAAPYIEPEELKKILDKGEEIYLIDARNKYEWKIGRFKGATTSNIRLFSELPKFVKQIKHLKNKKVITYCTGGIRCEKASAYLKRKGFKNVRQLHGGIIRYGHKFKNSHWEGRCFVFDKRVAINLDPEQEAKPIARCELCNIPADNYYNCRRIECDKRFITCDECLENIENCCSKHCRNIVRNQKEIKQILI